MTWNRVLTRRIALVVNPPKIVGKARPRITRDGNAYTPKSSANAEKRIRDAWRRENGTGMKDWSGPVGVSIVYSRPLAKSNAKYRAGQSDTGKPDADNVCKLVLDALNGLAFHDDSQVIELKTTKQPRTPYGTEPMMAIVVEYFTETREK